MKKQKTRKKKTTKRWPLIPEKTPLDKVMKDLDKAVKAMPKKEQEAKIVEMAMGPRRLKPKSGW